MTPREAELDALARDHYDESVRSADLVQELRDQLYRVREWVDENQEHDVYEADSLNPEECTDECAWCQILSILTDAPEPDGFGTTPEGDTSG